MYVMWYYSLIHETELNCFWKHNRRRAIILKSIIFLKRDLWQMLYTGLLVLRHQVKSHCCRADHQVLACGRDLRKKGDCLRKLLYRFTKIQPCYCIVAEVVYDRIVGYRKGLFRVIGINEASSSHSC